MSKQRPVPRWVKVLFWIWFIVPIGISGDLLDFDHPTIFILSVIGAAIAIGGPLLLIGLRYGTDGIQELYGASRNGADSKDVANLVP